ncbi:hypothetical protein KVT40_006954 [Elsinoe batatas]|uniref:DNA recombination and repair protein Rad51-like C-terminal domain-containing protein n=1 Tax=Elsinoe batatas TaxID=2601811 RepID=A0A8K0KZ25_9PEZI|nr:hypothetical protein KVT40_006954 [Elsinoe batatas]
MSAQEVGRKLLGEVEEADLSKIFSELRQMCAISPTTTTGIPAIDDLANIFTHPQPVQRSSSPTLDYDGFSHVPRPVLRTNKHLCLEVLSTISGEGKSLLLYSMIARAILPPSISGISLQGQNRAVVYFDTDGNFSIARLVKLAITHVAACAGRMTREVSDDLDTAVQDMIETSLQHLHVFFPQTIDSLISSIESLTDYLKDKNRHLSMHRNVHSIMLDSASAFYWADRHETDLANVPDTIEEATQRRGVRAISAYPALRSVLTRASRQLQCPIIYTATDLQPKQLQMTVRSLPSSLPKSWHTFPDIRLLVQKRPVRPFPVATSANEAARDANDRNAAVDNAPFDVVLNQEGKEDWSPEVRDQIARTSRGRFVMRISEDKVEFD